MKYIDAEKLIAEINNRLMSVNLEELGNFGCHRVWAYNDVKDLITSLQQEQPKKNKNCSVCPHCVDRKDQNGWHFKGCFGGPYKGKFIAEIEECPLQQEQPEVDLEREIRDYFSKWDYSPYDGVITMDNDIVATLSTIKSVARHFYELGLKAKKEE